MIIRDSIFESNPWGGGGRKRTAQISEILAQNALDGRNYVKCPQLVPSGLMAAGGRMGNYRVLEKTLRLPLGGEREQDLDGHVNECRQIFLDKTSGKGCLLCENTRSGNYFALLAAQQAGLSIVALPHNLESLVPGQRSMLSGRSSPDCFDEELAFLAVADSVFAISREEQWLLRLHGINADYLPYYPPSVVVDYMSGIREKRKHSTEFGGYLLLGTILNPPTMQGMVEFICKWPKLGNGRLLHVAGFYTERLIKHVANIIRGRNDIVIHGTVKKDELEKLLVSVQAVILSQPPTTGALTRIPEMQIAGVPVLANRNAARNSHETDGLHIFDEFSEMKSLIACSGLPMPPPPSKPEAHEARFVRAVNKVCL